MSNIENAENIMPVDESAKPQHIEAKTEQTVDTVEESKLEETVEPESNATNVADEAKTEDVKIEGAEAEDDAEAEAEDEEEDDEEEDDEDEEETRTPEELIALGKQALSESDWESAVMYMESALTRQMDTLELDENSISFELASYYLRYGDALLQKEEHSSELFVWDSAQEGVTTEELEKNEETTETEKKTETDNNMFEAAASAAAAMIAGEDGEGAEGDANGDDELGAPESDLQCAWETLEMARLCFAKKDLSTIPDNETEEARAERIAVVLEASFASIRLADLLLVQEKYEESIKEYRSALEMRQNHKLHSSTWLSCIVPMAQLEQTLGNKEAAEETYNKAISIMEESIKTDDSVVSAEKKESYVAAIAELKDNIKSLHEKVEEIESGEFANDLSDARKAAAEAGATVRARMMQGEKMSVSEDGTVTFSESKLEGEAVPQEVVVATRAQEDETEEGVPQKKRRVVM